MSANPVSPLFLVLFSLFYLVFQFAGGGLPSIPEYCNNFSANLRPLICILRDNNLVPKSTSSTTRHPWETTWPESESEEEDSSCACDITCFPPASEEASPFGSKLDCRPCGTVCDVTTAVNPRCSCAAVGSGLKTVTEKRQQNCRCSATCARPGGSDPWEGPADPFCIFNVTGLRSYDGNPQPVACECCKSKAAEMSDYPDFVCVCQRSL